MKKLALHTTVLNFLEYDVFRNDVITNFCNLCDGVGNQVRWLSLLLLLSVFLVSVSLRWRCRVGIGVGVGVGNGSCY